MASKNPRSEVVATPAASSQPPPKEDKNKSKGKEDATAGGDEDELLLGRCPNCENYGPYANLCSTCEDSGVIYETVAPGDSDKGGQGWREDANYSEDEEGGDEEEYITTGQCPNCHNYGNYACLCSTCEDTGFLYE